MNADDDPEASFPGASDWLELPTPEVSPDFVERTLAALGDAGLVASMPAGADAPLPREILDDYAPPLASRDFVDATLARVRRDRAEHWRQLLLRYESPTPTVDFVARTLQALAGTPRRRRSLPWRLWTGIAAAAALVLAWSLWRPAPTLADFVAAAPANAAYAHSPAMLSHLLARQLPADAASAVAGDGAWLWLAAAEAGR